MHQVPADSDNIDQIIGHPFDLLDTYRRGRGAFTTAHPRSSYGLPVLVYEGQAYGPADLPGLHVVVDVRDASPADIAAIRGAGWQIETRIYVPEQDRSYSVNA